MSEDTHDDTTAWLARIAARLTFRPLPPRWGSLDLQPGDVLREPNGTLVLVGEVNTCLGGCDCCRYTSADSPTDGWGIAHLSDVVT